MATTTTEIGYINACIAGDYRYSSRLSVQLDGDKCHVILTENGAVGGMDGPGGSTPFAERARKTVEAKPELIIAAVKSTMDDTIKRYGTPTKKFVWVGVKERGLSVRRVIQAISFLDE